MKDLFEILIENNIDEETAYNIVEKFTLNDVKNVVSHLIPALRAKAPENITPKMKRQKAIMQVLNANKADYLARIGNIQGKGNYIKHLGIPELKSVAKAYKRVSDSCYNDILDSVHYYLCETENNPINFEKEKMAREINKMMQDGSLENVRQTKDGSTVIGTDTQLVNKLNNMKKRAKELKKG